MYKNDKLASPEDLVSQISDGMTIGIGGFGAQRKPMALVRELCKSSVSDLTVVSYGGPDVGALLASGKVKRLIFSFVSLDVVTTDPHFQLARENGEVEVDEYDEGMLWWGLYAAGLRLPFLPTTAGMGSDLEKVNGRVTRIDNPFGQVPRELLAVPAIDLDVALVHVHRATRDGICHIQQGYEPYFDRYMIDAAQRAYISAESIVDISHLQEECCTHGILTDRGMVHGVTEARGGAHPTACQPLYDLDADHLHMFAASVGSSWTQYGEDYINVVDHERYLEQVGWPESI